MKPYTIETTKNIKDFTFALLSDIHYSSYSNTQKVEKILENILKQSPAFICMLGDTVNDAKIDKEHCQVLLEILNSIAHKIPMYIILGNHDQLTYNGKDFIPCSAQQSNYLKMLKLFPSIKLLQNQRISFDNISITGLAQEGDFYVKEQEDSLRFKEICNKEFPYIQNPASFNIVLQHTPNPYVNKEIAQTVTAFQNTDLICAGHIHNGCIPTYFDFPLNKIHIPNRGIIGIKGDRFTLFPKNARGIYPVTDTAQGITSAPIQTFGDEKLFKYLNFLYPPKVEYVHVKKKCIK